MRGANLMNVSLCNVVTRDVDLRGANLIMAESENIDLSGSDLRYADGQALRSRM